MFQSMTPREAFIFAQKIRTNLDQTLIEVRADQLISSLGLNSCADIQIGSNVRQGELKRISIGYELISNPSLLLLDEPTSGLDSIAALSIAKLLKKESRRGLTVVATIHTPSAETFLQFDRVILLSEGMTIYNGSPHLIKDYFEEKGFAFKKFSNLADWLLKVAMDTEKLCPEQSIRKLAICCDKQY